MTDTLDRDRRSRLMAKVKAKDTTPELIVRKMVRAMGHRYRLHVKTLPGSPDLVFSKKKKAIFVHGCFWHRHPDPACKKCGLPKSNIEFWKDKFDKNVERDRRSYDGLINQGWQILIVWQCELKDYCSVENAVRKFLT